MADSTIEYEHIAASDAVKEAILLKKFITGLDVVPSIANPVDLYCDNNGLLLKLRSLDHIKEPSTYLGDITSIER